MLRDIPEASQAAKRSFPAYNPRVFKYGEQQFLLKDTPYGTIVLVQVEPGVYLAAAEHVAGPVLDPMEVDPKMLALLRERKLTPWKLVQAANVNEAIRALAQGHTEQKAAVGEALWSPYLNVLPAADGTLAASQRCRVFELLRALVPACGALSTRPLPLLCGPDGVGKRFLAAKLAAVFNGRALELPLSRILLDRIFSTQEEFLLDTLLAAAKHCPPPHMLVISDAEALGGLKDYSSDRVLDEVARTSRVLLLARHAIRSAGRRLIVFPLPGLNPDQAVTMIQERFPGLQFSGVALPLLLQAASVPGSGVLPGRVQYLLQLALSMVESSSGGNKVLAPDEIIAVARLTQVAWQARPAAFES